MVTEEEQRNANLVVLSLPSASLQWVPTGLDSRPKTSSLECNSGCYYETAYQSVNDMFFPTHALVELMGNQHLTSFLRQEESLVEKPPGQLSMTST